VGVMIKPFSLDRKDTGWSVYVGGMFGSGKTTLLADMLLSEASNGPVAYVMTPTEGDGDKGGWKSMVGLGLGDIAYQVETYQDLKDLRKKFKEENYRAVALDTLVGLSKLIRIALLGEDRMPNTTLKRNEYGEIANEFQTFTRLWNNCAFYTMSVAPTDLTYRDDQTGTSPEMKDLGSATQYVRPMMDWAKLEFLIPGMFDLCWHIDTSGVLETQTRTLVVKQGKKFATKQRLPQGFRMEKNILLKDNMKNWSVIVEQLNKEGVK